MRKKELIKQLEKIEGNPTVVIPGYESGFADIDMIEQKKLQKTKSPWYEGTWQEEGWQVYKKINEPVNCVCIQG